MKRWRVDKLCSDEASVDRRLDIVKDIGWFHAICCQVDIEDVDMSEYKENKEVVLKAWEDGYTND